MSATNAAETALLNLIFANSNWANVGDATGLRGSSSAGSLYISLHTGTLSDTSDQSSSEANFTGYARKAVVRSGSGWTVSGNSASNTAAITFDPCTGGSSTVTYFGVGTDSSGAGNLLFWGQLSSSLAVSNGITPSFAIGALTVTAD